MTGMLMLAWPGLRARAYLQMLCRAGHPPDRVLLLGRPEDDRMDPGWGRPPVWDFDPGLSLRDSVREESLDALALQSTRWDDPILLEALRNMHPELVLFSGGGILPAATLETAPRWLHVHPGFLPDLRGSTCLYYGLLLEGRVGVSAFLMEPGLDRGAIVHRRHFPAPKGLDAASLDHAYDAWIRGRVLVEAVELLATNPATRLETQDPEAGRTFYVIHPVLKHLAILGCGGDADSCVPETRYVHLSERA